MTIFTDNLGIPHLDQNVAQPEIPENTAKDIFDSIFSATYTLNTVDALDITITHTNTSLQATPWQSFVIEITDDPVLLTGQINVNLPDNQRPYILKNSTAQALNFKTTTGTGFVLNTLENGYAYSDGVNLEKLEFSPSGAGSTLATLPDTPAGYGTTGQALITDGVSAFTYQDIVSSIGLSDDVTAGYGTAGQVLITDGTSGFTYSDISLTFIGLIDVDPAGYVIGDIGKAVVVNQTYDGLEFGLAGTNLIGPNEIIDDIADFGFIYTGTADISFASSATTGTGIMFGTQGFVSINTNVEFFNIDPVANETLMLGANSKITHADATVTTLNNPEYMAQNAQRTADIALKNTMDINMAIDTLTKASKITLTAIGSETGAGEYTFVIAP